MAIEERGDRRVFQALDGMRGVAAVFVAMRHTVFFHNLGIPGGYLAVDLFFVLSGFVIAHAYERRLAAGLSVGRFMTLRYVRLWPVYALGAGLGLIGALLHALPGKDNLSPLQVLHTAPYALAMLPGPHIRPMLYPVNSVAWSLALELLINAVYALAWRPMRRPWVLAAGLAVSALALVAAVIGFGKLDIGFQWRDAIGGIPRVAFSFTAGLALYRLYRSRAWRLPVPAWAPLAAMPVLFCLNLGQVLYPLVCVIMIFPVLVFAAAAAPEPGRMAVGLFQRLGAASYPLYALHKPVGEITALALRHAAPDILQDWPVLVGAPYLVALFAACILIERGFDRPARRIIALGLDRFSQAGRAPTPTRPAPAPRPGWEPSAGLRAVKPEEQTI